MNLLVTGDAQAGYSSGRCAGLIMTGLYEARRDFVVSNNTDNDVLTLSTSSLCCVVFLDVPCYIKRQ